jgi:peroxiredoxin
LPRHRIEPDITADDPFQVAFEVVHAAIIAARRAAVGGLYDGRVTRLIFAVVLLVLLPVMAGAEPSASGFRVKLLDSRATFDLGDHLGKHVVVLRFQASWCKPCLRESVGLARVAERYRSRGVELLAFHVQDTATDARRWIAKNNVRYPVALDPKLTIGNRFGVKGTPYTIVIDKKGEIVARIVGQSAVTRLPKILDEALQRG